MPVVFLGLGIFIFLFPERLEIKLQYAQFFGAMLIVYGTFRGFRAWNDIKKANRE